LKRRIVRAVGVSTVSGESPRAGAVSTASAMFNYAAAD